MVTICKWGTWGEINVIMAPLQTSDLLNQHLRSLDKH